MEPRASPDLRKGFELLDLDGGIGWELLTSMVRYKARQRTSAKAALAHPFFKQEGLLGLSIMQNLRLQQYRATQKDYSEAANWIIKLMAKSGTASEGGFTEAQLQELRVSSLNFPCTGSHMEKGLAYHNLLGFATKDAHSQLVCHINLYSASRKLALFFFFLPYSHLECNPMQLTGNQAKEGQFAAA